MLPFLSKLTIGQPPLQKWFNEQDKHLSSSVLPLLILFNSTELFHTSLILLLKTFPQVRSFSKKEIQYDESDYEIGPILKTNLSYLTYLLNETQKIYQKIPLTHKIQKEKLKEKIDMIKFCIKKAK